MAKTKPPLITEFGLTLGLLKEYISDLPDTNERGEDNYVWIGDTSNLSNLAYEIWCDGGAEIIIQFNGFFHSNHHVPKSGSDMS